MYNYHNVASPGRRSTLLSIVQTPLRRRIYSSKFEFDLRAILFIIFAIAAALTYGPSQLSNEILSFSQRPPSHRSTGCDGPIGMGSKWAHSKLRTLFVQWIESNQSEFAFKSLSEKLNDQKDKYLAPLFVVASDSCNVIQKLNMKSPFVYAHSLKDALIALSSSKFIQSHPTIRILGWSAAPLIIEGKFAQTIRALEHHCDGYERWIAAGRLQIDSSIDTSIFYPKNNHARSINSYPSSETIFSYPFNVYYPDWFLPLAFAPIKHIHAIINETVLHDEAMTLSYSTIHQLIDITETLQIRFQTPFSPNVAQRIERESLASTNIRAMLRQSTLSTRFADNDSNKVLIETPKWPLGHVLRENAPLKTLIVSSTNCGYLDFAQNWLLSLRMLPDADAYSNSLMLIAEDLRAFQDLERIIPGRCVLPPFDVSEESKASDYSSSSFGKLVSSRPQYLIKLHEQGYTFLWSDMDIVFNRNPMPHVIHSSHDYVGQLDGTGNPNSPDNVCTCFLFMRPGNAKLNQILHSWYELTKDGLTEDQGPFNRVLLPIHKSLNMTILQPTHQFPAGNLYFRNPTWYSENNEMEPVFIHNNWIVGHDNKRDRFIQVDKWFVGRFKDSIKGC